MEWHKINLIYFSATSTTAKTLTAIAQGMGVAQIKHYDITQGTPSNITIPCDEIAVFGVPVYSGRVPQIALDALNQFMGNDTPAVIVCVYGNRDFDDALLELKNIVVANGFNVVSAGAFIAQHSIFPLLAMGRPDSDDLRVARDFGRNSLIHVGKNKNTDIKLKGNFPYRDIKSIPLHPKTSKKKCTSCGLCAKKCPASAISESDPAKVDKTRCISCARCISVCPVKAKKFGGFLYHIVSNKFSRKYVMRQFPYIIYR